MAVVVNGRFTFDTLTDLCIMFAVRETFIEDMFDLPSATLGGLTVPAGPLNVLEFTLTFLINDLNAGMLGFNYTRFLTNDTFGAIATMTPATQPTGLQALLDLEGLTLNDLRTRLETSMTVQLELFDVPLAQEGFVQPETPNHLVQLDIVSITNPTMQTEATLVGLFRDSLVNPELLNWNIQPLTIRSLDRMFENALNFNRSLANLDVSGFTSMNRLLNGAREFRQYDSLLTWDYSGVADQTWELFVDGHSFTSLYELLRYLHGQALLVGVVNYNVTRIDATFSTEQLYTHFTGQTPWETFFTFDPGMLVNFAELQSEDALSTQVLVVIDTNAALTTTTGFEVQSFFNNAQGGLNEGTVFLTALNTPFLAFKAFSEVGLAKAHDLALNVGTITAPVFNGVSLEGMFQSSSATSVQLMDWTTTNVTNMSYMFHNAAFDPPNSTLLNVLSYDGIVKHVDPAIGAGDLKAFWNFFSNRSFTEVADLLLFLRSQAVSSVSFSQERIRAFEESNDIISGSTVANLVLSPSSSNTDADLTPHLFNGTPEDVAPLKQIIMRVHCTASGVLRVYQSIDKETFFVSKQFNYVANRETTLSETVRARYMYVEFEYTGTSGDAELNLQTQGNHTEVNLLTTANTATFESDAISSTVVATTFPAYLETITATNLQSQRIFLKLYDQVTTVDPAVDRPLLTVPVLPQNTTVLKLDFLYLQNGLQLRATHTFDPTDTVVVLPGDCTASIMYRTVL